MKKDNDEMRPEYTRKELKGGVRGKYYEAYTESHNIVLLDPEVVKIFPTEKAVNEALLYLAKIVKTSVESTKDFSGHT